MYYIRKSKAMPPQRSDIYNTKSERYKCEINTFIVIVGQAQLPAKDNDLSTSDCIELMKPNKWPFILRR